MTELRAGDKIVIAFPSTVINGFGPLGADLAAMKVQAEQDAANWTRFFAAEGITVVHWDANTGLASLQIVAVIR